MKKSRRLKWPIFEALFKKFQQQHGTFKTRRAQAFGRYIQKEGIFLERFSVFQALTEYFGTSAWAGWPEEFQNPESVQVKRFRIGHKNRVRFFQYLQWQCEEQLQGIKRTARRCKNAVGTQPGLTRGNSPVWRRCLDVSPRNSWMGLPLVLRQTGLIGMGKIGGLVAPLPAKMRANHYQFFY